MLHSRQLTPLPLPLCSRYVGPNHNAWVHKRGTKVMYYVPLGRRGWVELFGKQKIQWGIDAAG